MRIGGFSPRTVRPLGGSGIAPGSGRVAGFGGPVGSLPKLTAASLAGALNIKFGSQRYTFIPQPPIEKDDSIYISMRNSDQEPVMLRFIFPQGMSFTSDSGRGGARTIVEAGDLFWQLVWPINRGWRNDQTKEWYDADTQNLVTVLQPELEAYWDKVNSFNNICPDDRSSEEKELFHGLLKFFLAKGKGYSLRAGADREEFPKLAYFACDFTITVRCDAGDLSYAVAAFNGDKVSFFAKGTNGYFLEQEISRLAGYREMSRSKMLKNLRAQLAEIDEKEEKEALCRQMFSRMTPFFPEYELKDPSSDRTYGSDFRFKLERFIHKIGTSSVEFYFLADKIIVCGGAAKQRADLKKELETKRGERIKIRSVFVQGKRQDNAEQWEIGYEDIFRLL